MITVDARAAGTGKTTTTIWPMINQVEQCLVVVPSLALQDTYRAIFPDFIVIRSSNDDYASRSLLRALEQGFPRIICTSQCFTQTIIPESLRTRLLIIDEVFQPWNMDEWQIRSQGPDFKWQDYATIDMSTAAEGHGWCRLDKNFQDAWIDDSPRFRKFSNNNYNLYQTKDTYDNICGLKQEKVFTVLEIRPEILDTWPRIHVAAAAFNQTFFKQWLVKHQRQYKITQAYELLSKPLQLHSTAIKWSKNQLKTNPGLRQQFLDYVKLHVSKDCLRLKNLVSRDEISSDEIVLKHNNHGINEYRQYTSVVLESSLNFNPAMQSYLTKFIGLSEQEVVTASAGYTYYQSLMRSNLRTRDNHRVDVFVLDERYAESLFEFFALTPDQITEIPTVKSASKPRKPRSDKGTGVSARVRMRQMRVREQKEISEVVNLLRDNLIKHY